MRITTPIDRRSPANEKVLARATGMHLTIDSHPLLVAGKTTEVTTTDG